MSPDTSVSNKPADVFKTFPRFSQLKISDRAKYEAFVKGYPPLSDLAFPTLMYWWNSLDSCAVAVLNGNLVISYWLPGIERFSGLAVVGTSRVEETMCQIFDHQRSVGDTPRLTHVPEFVIPYIEHPELFVCKAERAFDEYIYRLSNFVPFSNMDEFRRKRVTSFIRNVGKDSIVVKSIDLNDADNMRTLLRCVKVWRKTGYLNDSVAMEVDAMHIALQQHDMLGTQNICLFVDGKIQAFCLYYRSHDRRYAVMTNARVNTDIPRTLDYAIYAFSQKLVDEGLTFMNLECDLGSKFMRTFKLALGPSGFFRKYTIEPAA